jgi:hypothetical protein
MKKLSSLSFFVGDLGVAVKVVFYVLLLWKCTPAPGPGKDAREMSN